MNYKKWLIEDLKSLEQSRFSIKQAEEELITLEAEFTAIKATNFDKMPSGSGDNVQEEKLLDVIAKKDECRTRLEYNRRFVADMQRLLEELPDDERHIIECAIVQSGTNAYGKLADELGYSETQIWRLKNKSLNHLARLKFGVTFRP